MAKFTLQGPDGQSYDVEATDPVAAHNALQALRGQSQAPAEPSTPAAQEDPRNTGVSRALRQFSDFTTLGYGPKLADYAESVYRTGQFAGPEQREVYRGEQALTEASRHSRPGGGFGQFAADTAARTAGGVAGAVTTLPLGAVRVGTEAARQGIRLSGEALEALKRLLPQQTFGQRVAEGARIGVPFGVAGGLGTSSPDEGFMDTLMRMGEHGVGGAIVGGAVPTVMEGASRLAGGARDLWRYTFGATPEARARATSWKALGLEPPAAALLEPGGQQRAGRLAGTLVGGSTRESIAEGTRDIEGNLRSALGVSGTRTANEAGQEAQDLVQRGLFARRSDEELNALGAQELEALSGATRSGAPQVAPTTPGEILARQRQRRSGLSERLAQAGEAGEEVVVSAPTPIAPARPRRGLMARLGATEEPEALASEAAPVPTAPRAPREVPIPGSEAELIREEVGRTPITTPRAPNVPTEEEVGVRQAQLGPRRAKIPERPEQEPLLPEEARQQYALQQRLRRLQARSVEFEGPMAEEAARLEEQLQRAQNRLERYARVNGPRPETPVNQDAPLGQRIKESVTRAQDRASDLARQVLPEALGGTPEATYQRTLALMTQTRDRFRARLEEVRSAQRNTPRARAVRELEELQGQIRINQINRWRQRQDAERARLEQEQGTAREAALHTSTREAEVQARLQNAQAMLAQTEAAVARAKTEYQAAVLEARADTLRRQVQAEAEHVQRVQAEDAAAVARGETPELRLPPRRESYAEQLEAGERALAAGAPRTQQPLLEQPNSAIRGALDEIGLGARGAMQLPGYRSENLFSAETGELDPGLVAYLRQQVGPRVTQVFERLAQQFQNNDFAQGVRGTEAILSLLINERARRGVNQQIIAKLQAAVERDLERVVGRTPEGAAWVQARQRLAAVKARIEQELADPLRAISAPGTSPAQALRILQQSAENGGDIRTLQAFLRLAEAKGDRTSAASLVLQGFAEGGMVGFTQRYRALSPEAKQLLFQGPMAALGARLERLTRAAETLERIAPKGRQPRTIATIRDMTAGIMSLLTFPKLLIGAAGVKVADSILGSPSFSRWLRSVPLERGLRDPEVTRQFQVLRGYLSERFGVNANVAGMFGASSARAEPLSVSPVVFGGEGAQAPPVGRQEAETRLAGGEAPAEAWNRTGWLRGADGRWRFEIDDSQAELSDRAFTLLNSGRGVARLGELVSHPGLYEQYPDLANVRVRFGAGGAPTFFSRANEIVLDPSTMEGNEQVLGTLLHEAQHWVQKREGFAYGDPRRDYMSRPGEEEARSVADRREYTPEERRSEFPIAGTGRGPGVDRAEAISEAGGGPPRLGDGVMRDPGRGTRSFGKGSYQIIPEREALGQHNAISRTIEELGGGRREFERFQRVRRGQQAYDADPPGFADSLALIGGLRGPKPGAGRNYPRGQGKERDTPLSEEETRELVRLWEEGTSSLRALGEQFGLSHVGVKNILTSQGVATTGARRRVLQEDSVRGVIAAHSRGASLQDIADDFGVSYTTVRKILREEGVDTSVIGQYARQNYEEGARRGREFRGRYVSIPLERVAEMRASGMTLEAIARETGSSIPVVWKALKRHERGMTSPLRVPKEMAEGAPYPKPPVDRTPSRTTIWRRRKRAQEREQGEE